MGCTNGWWAPLVLAAVLSCSGAAAAPAQVTFEEPTHEPTQELARRVLRSADAGGRPYAIVDKRAARITVYHGDGRIAGSSVALIGRTPGDASNPGVGERSQNGRLQIADQTTPAGRFVAEPGRNMTGERIVWIDYGAALAIHRVRTGPAYSERLRRLAATDPRRRRTSAGCVVVPVAFYESVVQTVLGQGRSVVYVLPEDNGGLAAGA